jgi:exonuclease VII small subunit
MRTRRDIEEAIESARMALDDAIEQQSIANSEVRGCRRELGALEFELEEWDEQNDDEVEDS